MSKLTPGHRLSRELSRRGNRRAFFWPAQYLELRRLDSVEELADFLDRTGYRRARASEDIDEVADDIVVECNAPGIVDPAKIGVVSPIIDLLLLSAMIIHRLIWGHPADKQ
ncbi:MAG: hypothetical protein N2C12_12755 [Planctomycetales bacterium]